MIARSPKVRRNRKSAAVEAASPEGFRKTKLPAHAGSLPLSAIPGLSGSPRCPPACRRRGTLRLAGRVRRGGRAERRRLAERTSTTIPFRPWPLSACACRCCGRALADPDLSLSLSTEAERAAVPPSRSRACAIWSTSCTRRGSSRRASPSRSRWRSMHERVSGMDYRLADQLLARRRAAVGDPLPHRPGSARQRARARARLQRHGDVAGSGRRLVVVRIADDGCGFEPVLGRTGYDAGRLRRVARRAARLRQLSASSPPPAPARPSITGFRRSCDTARRASA